MNEKKEPSKNENYFEKLKEEVVRLNQHIEELKNSHQTQMEKKMGDMKEAYLEFEDIKKENKKILMEIQTLKQEHEAELLKKETLLLEYQQIIAEQRTIIEKSKRYIYLLENKIESLSFEIKSLLQIDTPHAPDKTVPLLKKEEMLNDVKSTSLYDLTLAIKKHIMLAENFRGGEKLGLKSGLGRRFFGSSYGHLSYDLRQLFENFQNETSRIIFIYSVAQEKVLFVNDFVKTALGYSPDRFMKDFSTIVLDRFYDWDKAVQNTMTGKEEKFHLKLIAKNKQEKPFQTILGPIKSGPFSNHLIGLLSS